MKNTSLDAWSRLQDEVIKAGICTHCGTCIGLSDRTLTMRETENGPLPVSSPEVKLPWLAYEACPGKGINYPHINRTLFGHLPGNWLLGNCQRIYVGYATAPAIRRGGASGGVITQILIYLLEQGLIDGAVVVQQGKPQPWEAQPVIATSKEQIMAASQSVYIPIPVNAIMPEMASFGGRLAYVGLPDQVASLRRLQMAGIDGAVQVQYVLGPYVGTAMYRSAIESYLHRNGVERLEDIVSLQYREGEWPGFLQVVLRDGRVLRLKKFYYNYLIPFFITQATLQAVDFCNELTDISVGDAWSPQLETLGRGYSVVITRSESADVLIQQMAREGLLTLEEISAHEAIAMHAHMLDFKKRGAFIRNEWRRRIGRSAPSYGYHPDHIPLSRRFIEVIIVVIFAMARSHLARRVLQWLPLSIVGPVFDLLRRIWKTASRPVKRAGLIDVSFVESATEITDNAC